MLTANQIGYDRAVVQTLAKIRAYALADVPCLRGLVIDLTDDLDLPDRHAHGARA